MAKTVVIFNVSKTSNYLDDAKYSLEQIKIIDYADVLGSCLWTSYMSRYEDDPYMNVNRYPVWSEIKDCVKKRDWAEVYKLGKKFTSKVVKTKDLEMHGECAIKSYMNTLNYDNLFAIITSEKPKVIMQFLADAINERIDDNDFSWDLKWKFHSKHDKENTIVMEFPQYKFKLIPCNNAYQYYNMEDYYNELDFEVYDDKKLYESKKENKIMRKSIRESIDKDTLYAVKGDITVYEDSYEHGEGDYIQSYSLDIHGEYSLKDLMKQLSYYGFSNDPKDYMFWDENGFSEIMSDCMQNNDGEEPSKSEIEQWKNGEITLYVAHLSAHIYKIGTSDLSYDDAKELGFDRA